MSAYSHAKEEFRQFESCSSRELNMLVDWRIFSSNKYWSWQNVIRNHRRHSFNCFSCRRICGSKPLIIRSNSHAGMRLMCGKGATTNEQLTMEDNDHQWNIDKNQRKIIRINDKWSTMRSDKQSYLKGNSENSCELCAHWYGVPSIHRKKLLHYQVLAEIYQKLAQLSCPHAY